MSPIQYRCTDSADVDDHAASLSRWQQQYEQVSPGRFQGRLEELCLGEVQIFRERTQQAVLQRGLPSPGTLSLATPVGACNAGWYCGRQLGPQQAIGLVADREFELATRGEFDIVAISVERGALERHACRVDACDALRLLEHNAVVDGLPVANRALRDLLLETLAAAREGARRLEQEAARRELQHALCDALIARLSLAAGDTGAPEITVATRQRVVREARRYMHEHAEQPITVPDLCEALHVSRRTLQYSFQDVLRMSPVTYLRALRLNGVRRELRRGGDEGVADRAARWGFWHFSRFAADYRAMFGERPSETLQRSRQASAMAH